MNTKTLSNQFRAKLLRCTLLLLFSTILTSSSALAPSKVVDEWTLIKEVNGVSYYYRYSLCNDSHFFFFKVENTSSSIKDLKAQIEISESGKLNSTGKIFATLTETGAQTGNCDMMSNPTLQVRLKDDYQNPIFTITEIL